MRHARGRGRHVKRQPEYTGWAPAPLDEADQLAIAQAGHTPPMGFPAIQVPRQTMPSWARWTIAGLSAMAGGFVVLVAMLALALALSTDPATAGDQPQARVEQVTEIPDHRVRLTVDSERIKIVSRQLCPSEGSCEVNYVGDSTWIIERVIP